jgi:hypothetical protein
MIITNDIHDKIHIILLEGYTPIKILISEEFYLRLKEEFKSMLGPEYETLNCEFSKNFKFRGLSLELHNRLKSDFIILTQKSKDNDNFLKNLLKLFKK